MNSKNPIAVINQTLTSGVIERYAIGGTVTATFHLASWPVQLFPVTGSLVEAALKAVFFGRAMPSEICAQLVGDLEPR